jgi:radical SAM modification target selenobiotic family peptide
MDLKDIKKALAGVCVGTLLSGAGLTFAGSASQPSAGGADTQKKEAGQSG